MNAHELIVWQPRLASEQPRGKRLAPILDRWLPYYQERFGELSSRQRMSPRQVSPATLARMLAPA